MRKILLCTALLTLALTLALSQAALAGPSDNLKAVYDAMMAEDSSFSQIRATYASYYEGVTMDAALEDTGITVTLESTNEYVQPGSWTFTEEGDYLTITVENQDFYAMSLAQTMLTSAVSARGVNTSLFSGYLSALSLTEQENRYLFREEDEAAGTMKIGVNIAGPYEMDGLDELILTEERFATLGFDPLGESFISNVVNFGKVIMVINGNADSATILAMECGGLDDAAFQAITGAVKFMQPKGWEDFIAAFTELKDVEGENFSAELNVDEAVAGEILEDLPEGYSFALVRIGGAEE